MDVFAWIGLAIVLVLDLAASWRVASSPAYSRRQKALQLAVTWLVPVLGAVVCLALVHHDNRPAPAQKPQEFFDNAGQ